MNEQLQQEAKRKLDKVVVVMFCVFIILDLYSGLCGAFGVDELTATQFYEGSYKKVCRPYETINRSLHDLPDFYNTFFPNFIVLNADFKGDRQLPPLAVRPLPIRLVVWIFAFLAVRKLIRKQGAEPSEL